MNLKSRFVVAVALAMVLILIAAGTWAAPKFVGTVPPVPETGASVQDENSGVVPPVGGGPTCSQGLVDMRTALFTPDSSCIKVENIADPAGSYAPAPEGKAFLGDVFKLTTDSPDAVVQVCYAYPPEIATKEAKIYKLNEEVTPFAWVEIPGAVVADGTICVSSTSGVFALIGNP